MDYIELKRQIGEMENMDVWQADVHHEKKFVTKGFALVADDAADWFENNPMKFKSIEELINVNSGWRLPAFMPGHKPEQG